MIYERGGKRLIDVTAAAVTIVLLSPLLAVLAIGARWSSPGPAIYRQMRVGRDGAPFQVLKFRSMPADTREVSSDLLGKIELRPFGRFIRRTSMDELPQLFNILRGDMSFVGPRPPLPSQVELVRQRVANGALKCRPGLTGLAQIHGYDDMPVAEKAAFDGAYCQRITLLADAAIVVRTLGYLLRPPPTY